MRPSDVPQVPAGDQPAPSQEAPFYAVVPLTFCPHLADHVKPVPTNGIDAHGPCSSCQDASENWVCLNCYQVFCSRYVNGHMTNHAQEQGHQVALSLADISVWCFACDFYVANEIPTPVGSTLRLDGRSVDHKEIIGRIHLSSTEKYARKRARHRVHVQSVGPAQLHMELKDAHETSSL